MQVKNEYRKPEDRDITWGKWAGKRFGVVPTSYLEWFVKNGYHQMVDRKRWAMEELDRRKKLILVK